jgi:hypothetical protein
MEITRVLPAQRKWPQHPRVSDKALDPTFDLHYSSATISDACGTRARLARPDEEVQAACVEKLGNSYAEVT